MRQYSLPQQAQPAVQGRVAFAKQMTKEVVLPNSQPSYLPSFLYLKHNLCLDTPHSIRRDFLRQEIFAKLIMYNFASLLAFAAGEPLQSGRYPWRLSFSSTIRIARLCIVLHRQPPDSEIIATIQRHKYPVRTHKNRPRNIRSQRLNHLQNRA